MYLFSFVHGGSIFFCGGHWGSEIEGQVFASHWQAPGKFWGGLWLAIGAQAHLWDMSLWSRQSGPKQMGDPPSPVSPETGAVTEREAGGWADADGALQLLPWIWA